MGFIMRCLDLFCGRGLASAGYWRSGCFSEVVGVDIEPSFAAYYPFDYVCQNALSLTYEFLDQFHFIHASPPCQAYSYLTPVADMHPRLVAATRLMLAAAGKPHVVENVQGSLLDLRPNLSLDGHYFGLPIERRRYFYVSCLTESLQLLAGGSGCVVHGSVSPSRDELVRWFGLREYMSARNISKLDIQSIKEGIPPVMAAYCLSLFGFQKFMIG